MARIVFAVFGSLGDLHPHLAVGLELKARGHTIAFATIEYFRERIELLGFEFYPMRPNIFPDENKDLARDLMDAKKGTERIIRELLFPAVRDSYTDLMAALPNADLLISGEVAYAAPIAAEKSGVKWVTTTLAPGGFLSIYDPFVPPTTPWMANLRFLGAGFHRLLYLPINRMLWSWGAPVREFRKELGLETNVEPIFKGKFSALLNLALFSKVLGRPQPDWVSSTVQCGFAFYDGKNDVGKMPAGLSDFLSAGDAPVVFTLGSAAVWDARDFFNVSAQVAANLQRRAVLLLGENPPPAHNENTAVFDYAPYSEVFPHAAAVVHQGGVGTTAQALRAGVPQMIIPFSHDQPDNAARCVRAGVARTIARDSYTTARVEKELKELLHNPNYRSQALNAKSVVDSENGVKLACDVIEEKLNCEN